MALPRSFDRTVGDEVAEVEGPGSARLLSALRERGVVVSVRRTERGYRVGIVAGRTHPMELAAGARDIERISRSAEHARGRLLHEDSSGGARERAQHHPWHRRPRPPALVAPNRPLARRTGPAVHVAAAGRNRIQCHRAGRKWSCRTRRTCCPGSSSWPRSSAACSPRSPRCTTASSACSVSCSRVRRDPVDSGGARAGGDAAGDASGRGRARVRAVHHAAHDPGQMRRGGRRAGARLRWSARHWDCWWPLGFVRWRTSPA